MPVNHRSCPCTSVKPEDKGSCIDMRMCAGRRATVALTSQASTVQQLHSVDAPVFVPPHLRTLFDTAPITFIADAPPYLPVFGPR